MIPNPILYNQQKLIQKRSTMGMSPNNAALLVEKMINEAKNVHTGFPIGLTTLDAEKIFDVVWHDGLMRKLFQNSSCLFMSFKLELFKCKLGWFI